MLSGKCALMKLLINVFAVVTVVVTALDVQSTGGRFKSLSSATLGKLFIHVTLPSLLQG